MGVSGTEREKIVPNPSTAYDSSQELPGVTPKHCWMWLHPSPSPKIKEIKKKKSVTSISILWVCNPNLQWRNKGFLPPHVWFHNTSHSLQQEWKASWWRLPLTGTRNPIALSPSAIPLYLLLWSPLSSRENKSKPVPRGEGIWQAKAPASPVSLTPSFLFFC